MKKQPEITEATKRAFILAFCELYRENPIERITVKAIAEKAGYSRVSFYNYFHDPYDLLAYIENEFIGYIADEITANLRRDKALDNFIVSFIRLVSGQELYSRVLLLGTNSSRFTDQIKRRLLPLFLCAFGLSPHNNKAVYVFEFYLPGIISIITHWMRSGQDLPVEELAALVEGILKKGVLSQL